jgi:Protein kinase domain
MRYQVGEAMGMGAVSTVYRGLDTVLHRPVVVKAVPPEHVPAYRNALRVTSGLTHPAIVATYDAAEVDQWLFLVQESVNARSLDQYLASGVPSGRALDLAVQLARALAYAHSHMVIHGDLTPTAILVDRRAAVRVNNFALPTDTHYFTAVAGTIPGQSENGAGPMSAAVAIPAGAAGDVWAVGLLLWQLLSTPIQNNTSSTADHALTRAEAPRREFRPDVGEDVRELVRRTAQPWHPHPIADAESLTLALEMEARALAGLRPPRPEMTPPALRAAREAIASLPSWSTEDTQGTPRSWAQNAKALAGNPWQDGSKTPTGPVSRQPLGMHPLATEERLGQPKLRLPSLVNAAEPATYRQPAAQVWSGEAATRPKLFPDAARALDGVAAQKPRGLPLRDNTETELDRSMTAGGGLTMRMVVLVGMALFLLAFVIGFFLAALLGGH